MMSENNTHVQFTEAPASITVSYTWHGFNCTLTLRDATGADLLKKAEVAITHLEKLGATPTPAKPAGPTNGGTGAPAGDAGEPPICKYHGKMKRSSKFAGWYCSHKLADGSGYCTEKVMD